MTNFDKLAQLQQLLTSIADNASYLLDMLDGSEDDDYLTARIEQLTELATLLENEVTDA